MITNRLTPLVCLCLSLSVIGTLRAQQVQPDEAVPKGIVFLFTGFVGPLMDSIIGTGTANMAKQMQTRGVRTVLSDPANWESVAEGFLQSGDREQPIAIVGYSLGAKAAEALAMRFQSADLAVQTLVLIDGSNLLPISGNVRNAVNYFVDGDQIRPSVSFTGTIRNVEARDIDKQAATLGHMTVSRYKALQDAVVMDVLDGDRVKDFDASPSPPPEAKTTRTGRRQSK